MGFPDMSSPEDEGVAEEGDNENGTGEIVGAIAAAYLGGSHVDARTGEDVVSDAVGRMFYDKTSEHQSVVIQLSTEGNLSQV